MTVQNDGTKAIEGQKTIERQNAARRKKLECPACRYKILTEADHEPQCPNSDWDRGDVIEYIMGESAKHKP